MAVFNPACAEQTLRERLDSLERDTERCFQPLEDGLGPAFFPAVLYAFATIDYLSSCWAGWNDPKRDRTKNQTSRMVDFLRRYCKYGCKESQIAVNLWRHKLMHTGEPRCLRNTATNEVYCWEIDANGKEHMILVPIDTQGNVKFQINPIALVRDLRDGILGQNGYLDQLRQSSDLQGKFLNFLQEAETYTISTCP